MSKLIDFMNTYEFEKEFKEKDCWGLSASFDAYECDPDKVLEAESIKEFVIKLTDVIQMKRFGDCRVVHFGEDNRVAGFSFTQLIETSLISGHIRNETYALYLDVFSCKYFAITDVVDFIKRFFDCSEIKVSVSLRD